MRIWVNKTKTAILAIACGLASVCNTYAQDSLVEIPNADQVIEKGYKGVDQDLELILDMLSKMTGRSILRPQALPTPKITFDSGGPITVGELTLAFESLLSLNGIGISPLGDRFLKVVPVGDIRTQAPELVIESLAERPASGKVVSKLFRLQHLDSQTFQQQIQQFLSPGFSSIIPFQNSNAVIVTDTISNLQRLEYVVGEVDKPSRLNIEPAFYALQFAQASEVAQQVQQMIEDARSRFGDQTGGNSNRSNGPLAEPNPAVPVAEGGSISQILFGSNTAISADDRTNQIIIMTAPSNLKFFEGIIQKLDIKADPSTRMEVIPLKHADAKEVASLLSQFVSGKTKGDTNDRTNSDMNTRNNRRTSAGNPTFSNNETSNAGALNTARNNATNSSSTSSSEDRDSQFSTFMTILADERSNALVISGTRSDLELMGALIDKIDVLLPQVRIEVLIAEVTLNESRGINRGMDAFSFIYDEQEDGSADISIPVPEGPGVNFLGLGMSGSFKLNDGKVSGLTINAILQQARSNSDVKLLSIPTLVTTHNKEASIIDAQSFPIITSSQSSSISDTFRQSVEYQDIGIELTVTPLIGPNDVIQLEIAQAIDDISGYETIGQNRQPIIARRQANSYVSVSNGELVILGGLQRNRVSEGKSRASLLGEIPLLGNLFRKKSEESTKSELMVFLRPQIIRTTDDVNDDAMKKLRELEGARAIKEFLDTGNIDVTKPRVESGPSRPATPKGQ